MQSKRRSTFTRGSFSCSPSAARSCSRSVCLHCSIGVLIVTSFFFYIWESHVFVAGQRTTGSSDPAGQEAIETRQEGEKVCWCEIKFNWFDYLSLSLHAFASFTFFSNILLKLTSSL